jgi:predicted RNA-binding Zn ribbon-like protein
MDLLWMDLLNSIWRDWRGTGKPMVDRLHLTEWQQRFLEKWGFKAEVPAKESDIQKLIKLRSVLQLITEKINAGKPLEEKDADFLNGLLKENPVVRRLDKQEQDWKLALVSKQTGWGKVAESIVTSFIETIIDGHQDRIKICDNEDCLWVYYDSTRNHSKKYCDDKACGNLLKVRNFRERKRKNRA